MKKGRTLINMITFLGIAGVLLYFGITQFVIPPQEGNRLTMTVSDASGLLPRNDVTVRGVPSGAVEAVHLNDDGTAEVAIKLDPGVAVTRGTVAEITRRSPIGDITINLIPGDGPPMPDGGHIPVEDTIVPPSPVRTIEVLARTLSALTPEDVDIVVTELSDALRGRGGDLASLSESGADLPERILAVKVQLESLIREGPKLLDVLTENRRELGDDISETALLADILRDRRFDLVDLMRNGADFAEVLNAMLVEDKPNIACLVNDFADINDVLAEADNLQNLRDVLDLNHYFFGAVNQIVQPSPSDGLDWFRVHFLSPEGNAREYAQKRPPNDVYGANACRSRFGTGVGPAQQNPGPYIAPGSTLHKGH